MREKERELNERLQDVTGKLGSAKKVHRKGRGCFVLFAFIVRLVRLRTFTEAIIGLIVGRDFTYVFFWVITEEAKGAGEGGAGGAGAASRLSSSSSSSDSDSSSSSSSSSSSDSSDSEAG